MAKKMWCYICDNCNIVSFMPIRVKGKKRELHFCQGDCEKQFRKRKKKQGRA